jgi:ubiquinone/menaquinone biosynthesis C-methylase UbiE
VAQIEFDESLAEQLEELYSKRDVLRRRALVREALGAKAGERILDLGCGPGFYVSELLDEVGADGSVVGMDASPAMLAVARRRVEGRENADFHEADATSLPVTDEEFDRALSVQVMEYVADIPAAFGELHRVLKPGGRVLIWDVDWATASWHSGDPERMRRMLEAWDKHLVHPSLPRTTAAQLRSAGFADVEMEAHPFATIELTPETYGGSLAALLGQYLVEGGGMPEDEVGAWSDEQRELGERGEFYFAVIQVCFTATRAG